MSECDKWIFFEYTLSKGGTDHVFHNVCVTYIIKFYDDEHELTSKSQISHNIFHKDNKPTKYKCQQNFFVQKFCIKGSWDTTGKLVKDTILKNEMKYYRCANVYYCYLKLNQDLVKNGQARLNKKWLEWEMSGEKYHRIHI